MLALYIMRKKGKSNRDADITTLGNAIEKMLNSFKIKRKFDEASLIASWEGLMGKTIANHTKRIFIRDKVLFVEIDSAPLKHEMSMSKSRIIAIFDKEFGSGVIEELVLM